MFSKKNSSEPLKFGKKVNNYTTSDFHRSIGHKASQQTAPLTPFPAPIQLLPSQQK